MKVLKCRASRPCTHILAGATVYILVGAYTGGRDSIYTGGCERRAAIEARRASFESQAQILDLAFSFQKSISLRIQVKSLKSFEIESRPRSAAVGGGDTRQEDVERSRTQSRISPSIQRILRIYTGGRGSI